MIALAILLFALSAFTWLPKPGDSYADRLVNRLVSRRLDRLALDRPVTVIIARAITAFPLQTQRRIMKAYKNNASAKESPLDQREALLALRAKIMLDGGIPTEAMQREFPEDFT